MKISAIKRFICVLSAMLAVACSPGNDQLKPLHQSFLDELTQLQEQFHIPGMAVLVLQGDKTIAEHYLGYADIENRIVMDADTTIPMASLTKMFTGILFMKAVEDGKLSLETPVNEYVNNQDIPSEIRIKHVLSHTSQGEQGKHFYYSVRFSWLTQVLHKVYGLPIEELVQNAIIAPLGLEHTYPLMSKETITQCKWKIAQPYYYEGEIKNGFVDYGYSASAGITSTVRDLGLLSRAMDKHSLITDASWKRMSRSFQPNSFQTRLPYGYGVFSQQYNGKHLVWAYGQYDCYSSIFIKVPEENLTFIIAANNNLLTDPARLIYGDINYSLFALSFLNHFVGKPEKYKRNEILARALGESFLAMYEAGREEQSKTLLRQVFDNYPNVERYGELSLLHNLSMLKTIAHHRGLEDFTEFDIQLVKISKKLLDKDKSNPYANLYYASYFSQIGDNKNAHMYFTRIAEAANYSPNWYTQEARAWLGNNEL